MERRVIAFSLIAVAMLMTFQMLGRRNQDAQPENPDAEQAEVAEKGDQPQPGDAGGDQPNPEIKPADDAENEDEEVKEEPQPRKFVTLGSVSSADADMLVTFDTRGGSVARIELPADKYKSLEDRHLGGYLGWLMPYDAVAGCEIRIVGPGTPAALATPQDAKSGVGLQVGDIIKSLAGEEVVDVQSYVDALKLTKPEDAIELVVERKGADAVQLLTYTATLTDLPLEVIKPEVSEVVDKVTGMPRTVEHPSAYLTSLARINGSMIPAEGKMINDLPLITKNWRLVENEDPTIVQFETLVTPEDLPQGVRFAKLRLVKTFQLPKKPTEANAESNYQPYGLKYSLQVFNDGTEPVDAAFRQFGATGLPTEGWWYSNKIARGWGGAGLRDVVWESSKGDYDMFTVAKIIAKAQDLESDRQISMFKVDDQIKPKFAGVDAVYFSSAMVFNESDKGPALSRGAAIVAAVVDEEQKQRTDCTYRLDGATETIEPGDKPFELSCTIFSGPKKEELLAHYGLQNLEYYGWFHYVSTALLFVLHFMHDYLYIPYGLGIIFLTLMVRGCLFPLSRKQARNMLIQQQLAPEMKKISEMYKEDPIKQRQAQQELFTKYNFNPLGGCGVMFLQLPIFLGLYRALAVDIQLRQAPFIPGIEWCSNLSAPDQAWYWVGVLPDFMTIHPSASFPASFLFLGPYLNILPLFTIALFLVQQKMFMPPAVDEQQKMQQQMMTYMMVFIGFMFFRVPSGLCIYFITQSVWGILERKLIPKPQLADLPSASDTITVTAKKPKKRPPGKK